MILNRPELVIEKEEGCEWALVAQRRGAGGTKVVKMELFFHEC